MKLKKLVKKICADEIIGIYCDGYFVCNCKAEQLKKDFLEAKVKSIWSGEYESEPKLNITIKGDNT